MLVLFGLALLVLFIVIVLLANFSDLYKRAASNPRKKRFILGALTAVILCAGVWIWSSNRSIGIRSGEGRITLNDGTVYETAYDDTFTIRDRGRKLGRLTDSYGKHWSVFTVQGDPSREYFYISSMGRGRYYKRSPQ